MMRVVMNRRRSRVWTRRIRYSWIGGIKLLGKSSETNKDKKTSKSKPQMKKSTKKLKTWTISYGKIVNVSMRCRVIWSRESISTLLSIKIHRGSQKWEKLKGARKRMKKLKKRYMITSLLTRLFKLNFSSISSKSPNVTKKSNHTQKTRNRL